MSYPEGWPEPGKMHFRLVNDRLGALDLDCDHGYVVTAYDLGFPAIREVVYPNSMDDGTFDTTRFYGSRAVTLDIALKPHSGLDRKSPFLAAESVLRDRLLAYTYPGIRSALILSENEDLRVKQALVRGAPSSIAVARQNYNHVSLSLVAPRGVFLSWDRRCYPFGFSAATPDTQTLTIVNEGTVPSHWVVTLSGESVKPRLILDKGLPTEQVLQLDYSTSLGDEIVVDSFSRTVAINGVATGFQYIDDNADWFMVPPGTSELTIEQDTYSIEGYPYAYWQPSKNVHRDNFTKADGALDVDWVSALSRPPANLAQGIAVVGNNAVTARDTGTGSVETRGYARINRAITGQQHYIEFQVDNYYQWPSEGQPGAVLPLITSSAEGYVRMGSVDRSAVALKVIFDVLNHRMDYSVFRYDAAGAKQADVIVGSVPWPIEARNRRARWRLEITTGNVAKVLLNGKQLGATATVTSAPAGTFTGVSLHWRANDTVNGTSPRINFVEAGGDTTLGAAWQTAPGPTNWATPPGTTPVNNPPPAGAPPWAWTTAVDPETGLPGALEILFCYYDQFI